ncbi:selenium metabolism-associated LysR family transcriptional regulator [Aquibacillus sp. 3ASR75-11]|uniref:Selenium metabolism-associated LysR family transcriptional regulator n=1 Tax=Terrihalobacillus insolitus TaxID=2950438 RepID=A0A9X4AN42_9BACI|nr:selenium metabolism-associated LysR family transcriptional regulator [Terrihalobacillus insolitus]MDC3414060.1 selenium metabolism-associated LysR family transcriptional regulator [Terrihalobacillus insolitus]MDC3424150.1 selenium metabolism-associated LysR family transcriptional regulator [Terrihalobacillus insolitus]
MNYEKLKTFITVADKKSFSEAAKLLYLSQPTITSQVKALEEHLNTTLFERTTKQVQLTQAAQVLYRYAKEIIRLSEMAEKEIISMSDHVYGDLEIACSLTIGENVLPQILGAFREAYPLIKMSVDITNTTQILQKVKDHVLDLGLIEAPIEDPELYLEPFLEDELVLVATPHYFEKEKTMVTLEELKVLPLVLREKGSGTRTVMNQHLINSGLNPSNLNVVLELGSTEAVKSAVESELGLSIISKSAIKKELQLGLIKTYQIQDIFFTRNFYIVYHREAVLKSTVDVFLHAIRCISKEPTLTP